ncbi:hypothetical protein BC936DRAFT_142906 [Jimgerdemannia flammicorona]|uniref:Uncharacterized protein n=2 Tax=Jimgerdemannia flammicorona TaxID=994334 RepID=A0A433DEH1_9FUNG|nr:hypothetical protein BC936DRAFT_142906 [Jimgerdemannia flammicorona]RUS34110.1 hypothetical protein BC938DRAFT_482361 [Jimgerdemannia flammicorona]
METPQFTETPQSTETDTILHQTFAGFKDALDNVYDSTIQKMKRSASVSDNHTEATDILSTHVPANDVFVPTKKPSSRRHTINLPPTSETYHLHEHSLSPEKLGIVGYVKDVGNFIKDVAHDLTDKVRNAPPLHTLPHPSIFLPADEGLGVWEVDPILDGNKPNAQDGDLAAQSDTGPATEPHHLTPSIPVNTVQAALEITAKESHTGSILEATTRLFPQLQDSPLGSPKNEGVGRHEWRPLHPEDHHGDFLRDIREAHHGAAGGERTAGADEGRRNVTWMMGASIGNGT